MTDTELKAYVKANLRVTTEAYDASEIDHLIASAKEDITGYTGVEFDLDNQQQCQMVVLYVKARFGDGDDRAEAVYEKEKQKLGTKGMAS